MLVRDDDKPTLDRCVACPPYTYSVEEAIYGQKMSVGQGEEIVCNPCPRGKATCTGRNDISPNPGNAYVSVCVRVSVSVFVHVLRKLYGVCMWAIGYWSPLSGSTFDTSVRREGHESTGANGSLVVNIYRCVPPTACLGANASNGKVHGECMPGAYGPLCGICNGTAGFAKSRDGCRRCCNPEYNDSSFSSNPIPSSPACTEFLPVSYLFLSLYIIVLPCIPSLKVRPKRYQPINSRNRCLDWCDRSPSFHGTEFCSELFRENVRGF